MGFFYGVSDEASCLRDAELARFSFCGRWRMLVVGGGEIFPLSFLFYPSEGGVLDQERMGEKDEERGIRRGRRRKEKTPAALVAV